MWALSYLVLALFLFIHKSFQDLWASPLTAVCQTARLHSFELWVRCAAIRRNSTKRFKKIKKQGIYIAQNPGNLDRNSALRRGKNKLTLYCGSSWSCWKALCLHRQQAALLQVLLLSVMLLHRPHSSWSETSAIVPLASGISLGMRYRS